MSVFFRPYEGKRPYVFISYSHRDSETVLNVISALNDQKLRLWYDEGIPAGSDWPKNIEMHMRECSAVLFFLSKSALASPNCYSEIKTAVETGKPILTVPLEETVPDADWSRLLKRTNALPVQDGVSAVDSIHAWKVLRRSFYRKWTDSVRPERIGLAAAVLLLAAASAALAALLNGYIDFGGGSPTPTPHITASPTPTAAPTETPTPAPTPTIDPGVFPVRFPDTQQEKAVRSILGKKTGDILRPELADVKELYFCGNQVMRSMDGVKLSADGTLMINGAEVLLSGKVSDLSVIGNMVFLERLALIDQPIKDLSPLNGLVLLKELYLSGNDISDLSALNGLMSLTDLHIEHTNVRDLTALQSLSSLRTVTVSADMLPLSWSENKQFKVILIP